MNIIDLKEHYRNFFKDLNLSQIKEVSLINLSKFQDCPCLAAFRLKEFKETGKTDMRDVSKNRLKAVTDCFNNSNSMPNKNFDSGQLALFEMIQTHFKDLGVIQTYKISFGKETKVTHKFNGIVLEEKLKKRGGPLEIHLLGYLKRAMQEDELRFGLINRVISIFLYEKFKLKQPPRIFTHFARLMKNRGEDQNNKPQIDTLSFQHTAGEMKRGGAMLAHLLTRLKEEDLLPVDVARFCKGCDYRIDCQD